MERERDAGNLDLGRVSENKAREEISSKKVVEVAPILQRVSQRELEISDVKIVDESDVEDVGELSMSGGAERYIR